MKQLFSAVLLLVALAVAPTRSHAVEPFDPEQPFNQAIAKNLLRSFLNQALDVLDEHFEMSGSLNPDGKQRDQPQHLKFRFYPEGKSKSRESITAEGWVDQSPDSSQQDFHFRFSLPKSPEKNVPPQFEPVL
jgi:hypothetical protein